MNLGEQVNKRWTFSLGLVNAEEQLKIRQKMSVSPQKFVMACQNYWFQNVQIQIWPKRLKQFQKAMFVSKMMSLIWHPRLNCKGTPLKIPFLMWHVSSDIMTAAHKGLLSGIFPADIQKEPLGHGLLISQSLQPDLDNMPLAGNSFLSELLFAVFVAQYDAFLIAFARPDIIVVFLKRPHKFSLWEQCSPKNTRRFA